MVTFDNDTDREVMNNECDCSQNSKGKCHVQHGTLNKRVNRHQKHKTLAVCERGRVEVECCGEGEGTDSVYNGKENFLLPGH